MKRLIRTQYTLFDALMADPQRPLSQGRRDHQLAVLWSSFDSMTHHKPTPDDWRALADAINFLETLVSMGRLADESGLIRDATEALAWAAHAAHCGSGLGWRCQQDADAVRDALHDYAEAMAALPERTMIECHRATEARVMQAQRSGAGVGV